MFDRLLCALDRLFVNKPKPKTKQEPEQEATRYRIFDRRHFYDTIRLAFGPLSQPQVDALNLLLDFMECDAEITDKRHFAYMLASVKHETRLPNHKNVWVDTYRPVVENRPDYPPEDPKKRDTSAETRYGYKTKLGQVLGNRFKGDGAAFKGVGYVQVTGRANAEKLQRELFGGATEINLTKPPAVFREKLQIPDISYRAMSYGMRTGLYTGKKLSDYINDEQTDYYHARKIINRLAKADLIAGYAKTFEKALSIV